MNKRPTSVYFPYTSSHIETTPVSSPEAPLLPAPAQLQKVTDGAPSASSEVGTRHVKAARGYSALWAYLIENEHPGV